MTLLARMRPVLILAAAAALMVGVGVTSASGAKPPPKTTTTVGPTTTTAPTTTIAPTTTAAPTTTTVAPTTTTTSGSGAFNALCQNVAYVNSATPTTNYGSAPDMLVSGTTRLAHLGCAVAGIPAGSTATAQLRVFSRSVNTPHTVRLHPQPALFSEATVTWNTLNTYDPTVLDSQPGDLVAGSGEWVALAAGPVSNGEARFTLETATTAAAGLFAYASDDYTTDVARRPVLVVSYSPTPTTTTATVEPTTTTEAPTTTVAPTTTTTAPPGPVWTNVVNNQFTAAGFPAEWFPYNGPNGSNDPNDCSDPANARVPGDGYLHLDFGYKTSGPCGATWYNGSMMTRSAYGGVHQRITVRWRTTATDPVNSRAHYIIPMRWDNDPAYDWWELEHDYCESSSLTGCTTALHHDNGSGGDAWELFTYTVDVTQWHTMRFETYPDPTDATRVVFNAYIDDLATPVQTYVGSTTSNPPTINNGLRNPVLQVECRSSCPTDTSDSQVFDIDWITVDTLT